MIFLINYLFISTCTDSLHHHHGILNYELIDCSNQKIVIIDENSYIINFIAFNISYNICLDSIPNYVSPNVYKMMDKNIKHLSGSICDLPEFLVNGFIDNNCFYGSIITSDYDISIEIPAIIDENYKDKILVYRSVDIINPSIRMDEPIKLIKNRKEIKIPKLEDVNMENKYCSVTVDLHTSFISSYSSLSTAISSVINAINYLNMALSKKRTNETFTIKFYLKEVNKVLKLPIDDDDYWFDPSKFLFIYNSLLAESYRDSCISSLISAKPSNTSLGTAFIGSSDSPVLCHKSSYGSVITRRFKNYFLSQIEFMRTFSHEVGHQLGSEHDPFEECTEVSDECPEGISDSECSGDDISGRYIMYTTLDFKSNKTKRLFSKCSIGEFKKVINEPAGRFCFEAYPPINQNHNLTQNCGNGILDLFEECDYGIEDERCCTDQCLLLPDSECNDFDGKCCINCKLLPHGSVCSNSSECSYQSICDGHSPLCTIEFKNHIQCDNQHGICSNGECIKDMCHYYNVNECEILQEDLYCKVACTENDIDCDLFTSPSGYNFYKLQNTSCNNGKGICSDNGICINLINDYQITDGNNHVSNDSINNNISSDSINNDNKNNISSDSIINNLNNHISNDSIIKNDTHHVTSGFKLNNDTIYINKKLSEINLFLISTTAGICGYLLFYLIISAIIFLFYRINKYLF